MALNSGKILMRRGQEVNFDPNKMMPGEWAVSLDSKFVRMCFSPGVCIRMATYEAFEADMEQIRQILAECQTVEEAVQRIYEEIKDAVVDVERIEAAAASALKSEENALNSANLAGQSANTATQKANEAAESANIASAKAERATQGANTATEGASTATQKANEAAESADNVRNMSKVSQSYAVGGTGTREGEDTDNAKYYNQQASDNADRAEEAAERASVAAGFGGTYTELRNKPEINDVELVGNKTLDELGIASKEALEETDNKVNIIIEKAELNIKETSMGENIHLIDSADSKLVEFGLYGKARQNTTSGKNLLPYPYYNNGVTSNGVTFTNNSDGSIKIVGKNSSNGSIRYRLADYVGSFTLNAGEYIVSLGGIVKNSITLMVELYDKGIYKKSYGIIRETEVSFSITQDDLNDCEEPVIYVYIDVLANADIDTTVYPMIRFASITDDTYEPYTGGIPAPNPDYPQDIDISGNSGNVKIVSCGKNLLKNTATATHKNGIDLTVNDDKSITLNGTATIDTIITNLNEDMGLKEGEYILSGSSNVVHMFVDRFTSDNKFDKEWLDRSKDFVKFPVTAEDLALGKIFKTRAGISKDTVVNNETIYPMIRLASDTDATYEPYKETVSTIPTTDFAGIKVSSNGNYTDSNGQQWIANEIVKYADGSGEKIQRVGIIDSYSAETITGAYMSTTGELTEGAKILYQLAEPIRTPLTAEEIAEIEKLSTFYPVTNISNDFDCGMKVKYIVDSKNYIDNQLAIQAKLQEEALLNMLLLMPEEVQASMIEKDTNNLLNESEV